MLESIRRSAESWGVKILFGIIILVFVFWGVGSFNGNESNVVAMVNERPILTKEFAQNVERATNELRRRNPDMSYDDMNALGLRRQVLSQMITDELLHEEAAKMHLTASPVEVAAQIRNIPAFLDDKGNFDKQRYVSVLSSQGMTPAMFEEDVRSAITATKLRRYVTLPAEMSEEEAKDIFLFSGEQRSLEYVLFGAEKFAADITPTEEQIATFYEENKETYKLPERVSMAYLDFTPDALAASVKVTDAEIEAYYNANKASFMQEEEVKGRHILIQVPDNAAPGDDDAAKAKIEDIIKQVQEGADFAELAKQFSQDPTAANGGELGWVPRGIMVENFEDALFSTEPGKMSEPVRTPFGWHVILVEDHKQERPETLEEASEEIRKTVAKNKASDTLTDKLDQGLEMIISGVSMEKIARELGVELKKSKLMSRSEYAAELGLDEISQDRLFGLTEGEPSDSPLAVKDGYLLAEVLEKKPAEYQTLEQVRSEVVEGATRKLALEQAKEAADAFQAKIKDGDQAAASQEEMQTTPPFGRQGFIQGLGANAEMAKEAFSTPKGQWLGAPYAIGDGYIVAKVADVVPPDNEVWEQNKGEWLTGLRQGRQDELFQAFVATLHKGATIEIKNEAILK